MDDTKSESIDMDVQNDVKNDKPELKLPFSIDNLLADKFSGDRNEASTSDHLVYDREVNNDDDGSSCSEQLDVESSTADAQEFCEAKQSEYASGKHRLHL